ncbi:LD-carboxypeptidase [Amycolatopsis sp. cmx-11-12]|uniref:LD-carboxypeptidase n=1 Tax=Amycolatopsis sp. cmx-11-12 TaxID=2785795 RepID=UPI003917E983
MWSPSRELLADSVAVLESWGLIAEVGKHALDQRGYLAGRDEDRLSDLNDAFRDPGVRAVIATTGGAGAYRIADGIDFDAVRDDPKPLVGFSDITSLHLALWRHCGLAGSSVVTSAPSPTPSAPGSLPSRAPSCSSRPSAPSVSGRSTGS